MAELNKDANAVINQAVASGETVTLLKHGKPIATITPIEYSRSNNLSAYDVAYVLLSVQQPCSLATLDAAMQKAAKNLNVEVMN